MNYSRGSERGQQQHETCDETCICIAKTSIYQEVIPSDLISEYSRPPDVIAQIRTNFHLKPVGN